MTKPPHIRTAEAACLAVMQAEPWLTLREIAERIGRDPHHLGPVFKRMLQAGRAQRREARLTPKGCVYVWAAPGQIS